MKMLSARCPPFRSSLDLLTHWGRVTHICVGKLTIIGSDNGLSPERRQAITGTNDGLLSIGPLGTNYGDTSKHNNFYSIKMLSAIYPPFPSSLALLAPLPCQVACPVHVIGPIPMTRQGKSQRKTRPANLSTWNLSHYDIRGLIKNKHISVRVAPLWTKYWMKIWDLFC